VALGEALEGFKPLPIYPKLQLARFEATGVKTHTDFERLALGIMYDWGLCTTSTAFPIDHRQIFAPAAALSVSYQPSPNSNRKLCGLATFTNE
jgi:hypothetical protein